MPNLLKDFNKFEHRYIWCHSLLISFLTYLKQIRSKLVGQNDLRSKFK